MSIEIREDELIVGNQSKNRRGVPLFPENAVCWILDQMDTLPTRQGDRFQITEEQKKTLREVLPYWRGKTLRDKIRGSLPPMLKEILEYGIIANENFTMSGPGHTVPDCEIILHRGFIDIKEECKRRMEGLYPRDINCGSKYNFYQACSITCDAMIKFAHRYAQEAAWLAQKESDEKRRKELLRIAENCRRVPAEAARDFWEALQSYYFLQVVMQIETNGLAIALGRPDQYFYPYYREDIDGGSLTRENAKELIECFYLKLSEIDKIYSNEATRYLQGPGHGQTLTLGGVTKDGRDATNELSYLLVEADRDIRLVQPDIAIMVHKNIPDEFLREVSINMRDGLTKPKVFNNEVIIQSLLGLGIPLEDARDWGALGCSEPVINGKTNSWGNSGHINLAKCLELALNDGKCMMTQKQMGPHTGDPTQFKTFDNVLEAFKEQVEYFVTYLVIYDNIIDRAQAEVAPLSLYSIVIKDCLEKGIGFNNGGARYNTTSPLGVGPITTGDSLAAIKTLVFEEKALTMEHLVGALKKNFEGTEDLRQMLINRAPKFGNDEDGVDALCNEVLKVYCDALGKYKNFRNGPFIGALYYLTANIPFGMRTAATPDGRKAGEPLNDGGISPGHGRDRKGATAVAKSVGKLDMTRAPHGSILNQRFHPSLIKGEDKLKLFTQYLRTFMDLGGWHTQFNVVTTEMLREAQKNPDQYRDLLIRVAGYSAYFTHLERELQEDIIARTVKMAY
jgi:formate C-acetyltransferase